MFSGARYTLELGTIFESPNVDIFDFEYSFYDEQLKCIFEEKFIEHYYFHEIGFETIGRFKQRLRAKLNLKMPYYSQLYATELEAEGLNFLLNKDLKETFLREVQNEENQNGTGTNAITGGNENKSRRSNLDDGVISASIDEKLLTGVEESNGKHNSNTETKSVSLTKGNEKESTTLISQGNIGTTSSAELLDKWRKVLINIDELIIKECGTLFMQIS